MGNAMIYEILDKWRGYLTPVSLLLMIASPNYNGYNDKPLISLINLLNTRTVLATSAWEASWCTSRSATREAATRETSWSTCTCTRTRTCLSIQLLHDRVCDTLEFLLFLLIFFDRTL